MPYSMYSLVLVGDKFDILTTFTISFKDVLIVWRHVMCLHLFFLFVLSSYNISFYIGSWKWQKRWRGNVNGRNQNRVTGLQKLFDHTFIRRRRQLCAKVFFYNEGTLADTVIRHQPTVNYAKDDLQIQLPLLSVAA